MIESKLNENWNNYDLTKQNIRGNLANKCINPVELGKYLAENCREEYTS